MGLGGIPIVRGESKRRSGAPVAKKNLERRRLCIESKSKHRKQWPFARLSFNYAISCHSELPARRSTSPDTFCQQLAFHERSRARKSAWAAELSRRLAHRLARLFADHPLVDSPLASTCDFALRARFPPRHGS